MRTDGATNKINSMGAQAPKEGRQTMKQAIKTYNNIMFDICREYNTIGTSFTEAPEDRNNWNLRDLVSEMQYTLDVYKDPNCRYWEEAHDDCQPVGKPWMKEWKAEIARMQRFINKYKDEALTMEVMEDHCSKYD